MKHTTQSDNQVEFPKMDLTLTVNGVVHHLSTAPSARLLDILREDLGLPGTKVSCEIGRCGACAVHLDGRLVNSCLVMAYQAIDTSVQTIEGLNNAEFDPIQRAFLEEGGFQCGYCTPGMIMAVKSLMESNPDPDKQQIQEALAGNLCRCTGYGGIIRAVESVIASLKVKEFTNIEE
ncbi:(2Fe-2S)-binding protein [Bacillus sp. USDA818B3_A]|uniref:(2Fe-2S)-binding protein n=1 Tax=Bacillus sp. USDA818B3_A TaxID=2698834 RepID=UPI003FA47376